MYTYDVVNQKESADEQDLNNIEFEADTEFRSSRLHRQRFLHAGLVIILLILSFLAGSLFRPLSFALHTTQGTQSASPLRRNDTRSFVPKCMYIHH